jgi:hypothetical protein
VSGDITGKGSLSSTSLTVTNLNSLASSQDGLAGWSSAAIARGTDLDVSIGVNLVTHASNRQAGKIDIYVIGSLNATPSWPPTVTGTPGTEGTLSFTDTEERDAACRLLASLAVDSSASSVIAGHLGAIAALFNGVLPPSFALFITTNATTTTTAGIAASGSSINTTPFYGAYT